ncbi:MAG: hypothetical protein A2136_03195 [Chloroflexi bacterium RBG_16_54_11]|nr:MAG: hypothetical protein A2136_03195 [Chloroflexi bacterium RBG_16_54_11]
MQVKIVRKHLHTDKTIAVKVMVNSDVLVHISHVFHERMQIKPIRAASDRLTPGSKSRDSEYL